jgi:hypothetical protein
MEREGNGAGGVWGLDFKCDCLQAWVPITRPSTIVVVVVYNHAPHTATGIHLLSQEELG